MAGHFRVRALAFALAIFLALPAAAFAASVKVRIEGKTRTLFGPTEVTVTAQTPLDALEQASILGEFYYHLTTAGFGTYVDQIGRYGASGSSGWVFKVDDKSPPVGADKVQLQNGDRVLWYYATFGATGGPPSLSVKAAGRGCYLVRAYDDNGAAAAVSGVVLHVGSKRSVPAKTGTAVCPGPHRGLLVRATAAGAVRSNAIK